MNQSDEPEAEAIPDNPEELASEASLYTLAGITSFEAGRYEQAGSQLRHAAGLWSLSSAADSLGHANSLLYAGRALYEQEDFPSAQEFYSQAIIMCLGQPQPDDLFLAQALDAQAYLHHDRDQFDIAEKILKNALELRERHLAPDDPQIAESLDHLGWLYSHHGHFDRAESLLKRAFDIYVKQFGIDHAYSTKSLENISDLYKRSGNVEEGDKLAAQVDFIRATYRQ